VKPISRTLFSVVLGGVLVGICAPVAAALPLRDLAASAQAQAVSGPGLVAILPVCQDRAFRLTGGHWKQAVHWTFMSNSTPAGMSVAATEAVLAKSFDNITGADNDCGRQDNVSARNVYDGRSDRAPGVTGAAKCTNGDGHNAIGFGRLPRGVLAATCTRHVGNRIVEADIRINSRVNWALSPQNCSKQELLEPTMTHEVGHVYGLGHVSERGHPLMTMSRASDGPCSNAASTLGLGDMLGLEALY